MATVTRRFLSLLLQRPLSAKAVASPHRTIIPEGAWKQSGLSWAQFSALRRLGSSTVTRQERFSEGSEEVDHAVTLSDSCVKKLLKVNQEEPDLFLRLTVDGGGCSGFQYRFEFGSAVNTDDRVFERDGAKVVVDSLSLSFLDGCTVDYYQELIRSSFTVLNNPNADTSCSCGSSFAPK